MLVYAAGMNVLPRAILFDLDDTILSAYSRPEAAWLTVLEQFVPELGPVDLVAVADAVSLRAREFWADSSQHKHWRMRLGEARRLVVIQAFERLRGSGHAALDAPLAERVADRFTAYREEAMCFFPGAAETIDALKRLGVRLALVTNGAADLQRAKIERFDLARRFDHVQIEGEHGFGKPEEQAYRHALQALGVGPQETWMVGDNLEWEVMAPQRLGIAGIWHDVLGEGLPPGSPARPDRIIRRLPELLPR